MKPLHIAILQMDLAWESPESNTNQAEELLKEAVPAADVIVLPEMFPTGFSMKPERIAEEMHGPSMYWMRKLAAQFEALVMGSVIIKEDGNYYNRFLAVDAFGLVHHYDKIKLFSMAGEDNAYTAGAKATPFVWRNWRIMPQVCYDLRFPENVRLAPGEDGQAYDLLVYVANWPSPRVVHWDTLLRARAIENQCYVIGANRVGADKNGLEYNGHSAILDPQGASLADTDWRGVVQATIDPESMKEYRGRFPAWRDQ